MLLEIWVQAICKNVQPHKHIAFECMAQVMAAYVADLLSQQPSKLSAAALDTANVLELLQLLVRETLALEVGDHQPFLEVGRPACARAGNHRQEQLTFALSTLLQLPSPIVLTCRAGWTHWQQWS